MRLKCQLRRRPENLPVLEEGSKNRVHSFLTDLERWKMAESVEKL